MSRNLSGEEIATMVTGIRLAVENALNSEEILASLGAEGYGPDELKTGRALADALGTQHAATGSSLGSQKEATKSTTTDLKAAHDAITLFRTKARTVFTAVDDPEAWKTLQLDRDTPQSTNTLITFGYAMVDGAMQNESISSALAAKGYGEEKLKSIRAAIEKAERSNSAQEQKKGARKGSTSARDTQLTETVRWWGGFKKTARLVLSDEQLTTLQLS